MTAILTQPARGTRDQEAAVTALQALSTADCLVDAGPVPSAACGWCDDEDCAAVGTCHVAFEDRTDCPRPGDEGSRHAGDWCPLHAVAVVADARDRTSYVDVEVRVAVTAGSDVPGPAVSTPAGPGATNHETGDTR